LQHQNPSWNTCLENETLKSQRNCELSLHSPKTEFQSQISTAMDFPETTIFPVAEQDPPVAEQDPPVAEQDPPVADPVPIGSNQPANFRCPNSPPDSVPADPPENATGRLGCPPFQGTALKELFKGVGDESNPNAFTVLQSVWSILRFAEQRKPGLKIAVRNATAEPPTNWPTENGQADPVGAVSGRPPIH
jgi:hypothetical protein